ncbi:unnamed protein product [Mytilus coruscus]|uniref:Uncharacterized protein n=1 Tax=Mytilus coruscus TaxID=42192 RepID=A0A6J8DZ31_MYTCO|nr:unnamed protein product [Mytilus coruscus]
MLNASTFLRIQGENFKIIVISKKRLGRKNEDSDLEKNSQQSEKSVLEPENNIIQTDDASLENTGHTRNKRKKKAPAEWFEECKKLRICIENTEKRGPKDDSPVISLFHNILDELNISLFQPRKDNVTLAVATTKWENNIGRLMDYQIIIPQYGRDSKIDTASFVCNHLDPVHLPMFVFFYDESAWGQSGNEFYRIAARRTVSFDTVSHGWKRSVTVTKVMCYKMSWLKMNYLDPLADFFDQLKKEKDDHSSDTPSTGITCFQVTMMQMRTHSVCNIL